MPVKKINKKVAQKAPVKKSVVKKTAPVKSVVKAANKAAAKPAKKVVASAASVGMSSPVSARKMDPRKLIKPLIFLLILALVYLLKDEVIVASVNGRPVTRWALVRNLEKQGASTALENMTLQMLVEQELKKAGITVTDEEMNAEISKIEEQLSAQGQNLDDLLKAQGLSRAEVKEQLALSKGLEKLLADKINVTDEEVKAYFEENKEAMGADAKFEEVADSIKQQLRQQKLTSEQQKWFAEIRKSAKINYYKFTPSTNL